MKQNRNNNIPVDENYEIINDVNQETGLTKVQAMTSITDLTDYEIINDFNQETGKKKIQAVYNIGGGGGTTVTLNDIGYNDTLTTPFVTSGKDVKDALKEFFDIILNLLPINETIEYTLVDSAYYPSRPNLNTYVNFILDKMTDRDIAASKFEVKKFNYASTSGIIEVLFVESESGTNNVFSERMFGLFTNKVSRIGTFYAEQQRYLTPHIWQQTITDLAITGTPQVITGFNVSLFTEGVYAIFSNLETSGINEDLTINLVVGGTVVDTVTILAAREQFFTVGVKEYIFRDGQRVEVQIASNSGAQTLNGLLTVRKVGTLFTSSVRSKNINKVLTKIKDNYEL